MSSPSAFDVLFAPQCLPFSISLGLMLLIGAMEGASILMGHGLSGALDGLLPDIDSDLDVDVHADIDAGAHHLSFFDKALSWLHVGRVPILILLVLFLTAFGLSGWLLQALVVGVTGYLVPSWLAVVPATAVALPSVRIGGGLLARIMPSDETEAVSRASFIGRVATITSGTARVGAPAQAKLRDRHGQAHYVLVEPDSEGETFTAGSEVLLVKQVGSWFLGIQNTSAALGTPTSDE